MPAILTDTLSKQAFRSFYERLSITFGHPVPYNEDMQIVYARNWKEDNRELRRLLKEKFNETFNIQVPEEKQFIIEELFDNLMNELRANGKQ